MVALVALPASSVDLNTARPFLHVNAPDGSCTKRAVRRDCAPRRRFRRMSVTLLVGLPTITEDESVTYRTTDERLTRSQRGIDATAVTQEESENCRTAHDPLQRVLSRPSLPRKPAPAHDSAYPA